MILRLTSTSVDRSRNTMNYLTSTCYLVLHLIMYTDSCPACGPISGPVNGYVTGFTSECGDAKNFFCNDGYELVGADRAYCNNGQWNAPTPSCQATGKNFFVVHRLFILLNWYLPTYPNLSSAMPSKKCTVLKYDPLSPGAYQWEGPVSKC